MLHNAKSLSTAPDAGGRRRAWGSDDEEDDDAADRKPLWQLMFLDEVPLVASLHGDAASDAHDQQLWPCAHCHLASKRLDRTLVSVLQIEGCTSSGASESLLDGLLTPCTLQ